MATKPKYLVFDCETIPDGLLLSSIKHPKSNFSAEAAIALAHMEAEKQTDGASDFINVVYHRPVAASVISVDADYMIHEMHELYSGTDFDRLAREFWSLMGSDYTLVSFNGRCFDLPVMELSAYRAGITIPNYFKNKYGPRNRFGDGHIDLSDFFSNYGAARLAGGLDVLAKMVGIPGKGSVSGGDVYELYQRKEYKQISEYCTCDTLDTYFVFLRTRALVGDMTWDEMEQVRIETIKYLASTKRTHITYYLSRFTQPLCRNAKSK